MEPVVEVVEPAHEERVQQPLRSVHRHGERESARQPATGRLHRGGVAPAHEDAAADRAIAGQAVDPADGVGPVVGAPLEPGQHDIEPLHAHGLQHDPRRLHPAEPQGHLHDEPGQPHAAHGGEEELTLEGGPARDALAVGGHQDQTLDELAERAVAVVVLAVDVAGHARPDRHEPGAGGDRREPAARQEYLQDVGEAQPRLAVESPAVAVESQDAIGPRVLDHEPAGRRRQRGVTVRAAQAPRDHRLSAGRQRGRPGAIHPCAPHRMAAPAGQFLQGKLPRAGARLAHGAHRASHAGPHTGP